MKYYATVAASSPAVRSQDRVERIERRVLDSNPLMEAFGKTAKYISATATYKSVHASYFHNFFSNVVALPPQPLIYFIGMMREWTKK